ncbi:hypothetical protein Hanom_Chr00s095460g01801051 [Helianthus anomalus]
MSSCTNCDCFDKANCTKKGFRYDVTVVDTENSTEETTVMEVPPAKNKGNCKCGANCSCTNCTCGH